MFTTGFKFFFGLFAALAVAAVVYGYSTGGDVVGPVSIGWKGGVGEHIGYGVLLALAAASLAISAILVAFRDADAEAQADLLGVVEVAGNHDVTPSFWPVAASFGVGATVIGLVLHPVIFMLGLALVALALVEWTMDAWADRATGDRQANQELRNRIMTPIEIPVVGALSVGLVVLAASRILLSVSKLGAVIVAGVVATLVLAGAAIYANWPGLGRRMVRALGVLGALALLVGGVVAAVVGEHEIVHHGPDTLDHADDHTNESGEPTEMSNSE